MENINNTEPGISMKQEFKDLNQRKKFPLNMTLNSTLNLMMNLTLNPNSNSTAKNGPQPNSQPIPKLKHNPKN